MRKDIFSLRFLVHLFHGDLRDRKRPYKNHKGRVSGYHHESKMLTTREVRDANRSKPERNGVYTGTALFN
jgi:hypothetical protein